MPNAILLILLGLAVIIMLSYRWYINNNGVFTIARKTGISKGGKNGSSSEYEYRYLGKSYHTSIIDNGSGEEYIFVKFILIAPSNEIVLSNLTVPSCLKSDTLLGHTWVELPVCK